MNEGDLFDNVDDTGSENTGRSERDTEERAERLFADADEAMPEIGEAKKETEYAEIVDDGEPLSAEISAPAESRRPLQTLPHAASLGITLAELRRRCGLSLDQAAEMSRIKGNYIEALEADNLADLPQLVFVIGFVKRLCVIYGVSAEDAESLVTELHDQLDYEIPEDMRKTVICREQDEANHRRLRNLTIALGAGAVLILALLILGGAVLLLRMRGGDDKPKSSEQTTAQKHSGGKTGPGAEPKLTGQSGTVTLDETKLMSYHERPVLKAIPIPAK